MYMGGARYGLRSRVLIGDIGVWLGTSSVAVRMSGISQSVFCHILTVIVVVLRGRSINLFMDHGIKFLLMFGRLLMQESCQARPNDGGYVVEVCAL